MEMAAEVELFKKTRKQNQHLESLLSKKKKIRKLSTTLQYVIIVTRQMSIQAGPQTLPATYVGITGMLTSTIILINMIKKAQFLREPP